MPLDLIFMRKMTSELNLIMKLIIDFNCVGVAGLQNQGSARCVCVRVYALVHAHIYACASVCVCGGGVSNSAVAW